MAFKGALHRLKKALIPPQSDVAEDKEISQMTISYQNLQFKTLEAGKEILFRALESSMFR